MTQSHLPFQSWKGRGLEVSCLGEAPVSGPTHSTTLGTATPLSPKGLISARAAETGAKNISRSLCSSGSLGIHPLLGSSSLRICPLCESLTFGPGKTAHRGGCPHQTPSGKHRTTALPARSSEKHLSILVVSTASSSLFLLPASPWHPAPYTADISTFL